MVLGEVPAAAPVIVDALGPLTIIAGLLFALGFVLVIDGLVKALLNSIASIVSFLPGVGGITASVVHRTEQAISNALGGAISGIESNIGKQWHKLARVLGMLWAEQKLVAENLWHAVQWVASGNITKAVESAISHAIQWVASGNITKAAERAISHAFHEITHLQKTIRHDLTRVIHRTEVKVESVAHGIYPRIRSLEHEVTRTIPREIKRTRALAREAEAGVKALWDAVRGLQGVDVGAIAAAAAATAVAALGLEWLRCSDGANRAGRSGCGLWDDVGTLLGLLADAALFASVCSFLEVVSPWISDIADLVIPPLTQVGAGLCPGTIGPPDALPAVTLHTPSVVDDTAYLP